MTGAATEVSAPEPSSGAGDVSSRLRRTYLCCLTIAFTVFSSIRILTYLPTVWAIHVSGDSSQHSLWTWVAWIGGNASMAAWLYETSGQRCNSAVVVSAGNALMCLATCLAIAYYRF